MTQKTILITGASSGLGAAFAHYAASQGCHLALVARRLENLEQIAEQLREKYAVQVEVAQLDVNEYDKILPIFLGLSDLLGGIDTVMINAGVSLRRHYGDDHLERDIQVLNTNVISAIACSDAAQKVFQVQGKAGQLLVIASYSAFIGLPQAAAYSASKAAVASYFNALRPILKKHQISVSIIYPGFVQTDLIKSFQNIIPIVAKADDVAVQMYDIMLKKTPEAIVPPLPWKAFYHLQQVTPKPVLRWISQFL